MCGHMVTARERVQEGIQKLLPCVCSYILHLFIAGRYLLVCVFGELASHLIMMCYKVVSGLNICLSS